MLQQPNSHQRSAWRSRLSLAAVLILLAAGWATAGNARADAGTGEAAGTLRAHYREFDMLLAPVQTGPGTAGRVTRVESRGGTATVAPGSYYVLSWRVYAQDAAGRYWRAGGNAWPDPILVPPGGNVQLPLAFPLRAYLNGVETSGELRLQLEYAGPFGERCGDVTVNELPPPPPSLRILDDRGRLVSRIRFNSQHGATWHAAWKIPDGLTGRYRAVPEPGLGPLQVDVGPGLDFELRASHLVRVPPRVGQPAPDFSLLTPGGQTIQLGFLRPRPVLLCFFCSCALCRAVATELTGASDLREQAQVVVVANEASVLEEGFRRETGLEALYLNDTPPVVATRYDSEACPRCWLIDEQGVVRYVNDERQVPAKTLVTQLRAALAAPRPQPKPQDLSHPPLVPSSSRAVALSPRRPVAPSRPQEGSRRIAAKPDLGAPPGQQSPARATGYARGVPRGAAPAPPPAGRGTVEADAAAFGLTLLGSGPLVTIESQSGRAPVAADRYDVLNWWAERRDAEGRLWRARGGRRPDRLTIAPGTTARLSLVSPIQAQFLVMTNRSEVEFLLYFGSSGPGRCSSVTVDGRDAPRPHIEVRDAAGSVIADLECGYCCGFKASARWHPPALGGPFTAVPKVDFGPFKVVSDPPRLTLEARRTEDAPANSP